MDNFRHFQTGADPFDRLWTVEFKWLQNGISIRHADTIDVKFQINDAEEWLEKVIALKHVDLLRLSQSSGHLLTDPWCMKLAALHLKHMIETGEDMEKTLVTTTYEDLERAHRLLAEPAVSRK
jgi:hypothetical protein